MFLKGRCRHCGEKISLQYPAVELICGVSFLLLAYRFPDHDLQFVLNIVFFTFLLIISGIDFNLQIIPHSLSLPLILFSLSVSPFNMLIGADIKARMINASASLLGGWAALYFIGWITGKYLQLKEKVTRVKLNKEALGDADPILLAGIGAFIGWKGAVIALFSASIYGLAIMLPVILAGKWDRSKPFAFGPLLAGGAVTFVLIGRFIESFYF